MSPSPRAALSRTEPSRALLFALSLVHDSSAPWLGRYEDLLPVRSRGSFHVVSARRAGTERRCTVVTPGPTAALPSVEEAFAEVERVHALLDHPHIPRVTARGRHGEVPYLELDCDSAMDGADLIRLIGDSEEKIRYEAADGFIVAARKALESAHAVTDPLTGKPVCLGRLSYASFLFAPSGSWSLVGFGKNFPVERDSGAPDGWITSFHATELSSGGAPSPMGDYAALLLLMRSMLPYVEPAGPLARLFRGEITPADLELFEKLRWFDHHVIGQAPSLRPSMAEAVAVSDHIRELLGVTIDPPGFEDYVGALVRRQDTPQALEGAVPSTALGLTVGPGAAWVAGPDGARQLLGKAQRRIVKALVDLHLHDPTATLTMWQVFEAGWPGERPIHEAGANRVYVTLTRLRQRGLRDVFDRFDDGYRIAPRAVVRFAE